MIPIVSHPSYSYSFNHRHRFPMEKFRLLHDYLTANGIVKAQNTYRPGTAKQDIIELAHCPDYLNRFITNSQTEKEIRRMGLPWSEGLKRRTLISPNGTLVSASLAMEYGIACHLAGGTHHAHHDFASGFCVLNDLAIASLALVKKRKLGKILIFDCDVHQGDGTATILQNEPQVFTCSIHCEKNFPVRKPNSDLDIALPKHMEDREYLDIVEATLTKLIAQLQPSLIIYDAGVDVYKGDPLGLLNISLEGIKQRERTVLSMCQLNNIPVATVIGGGYDDDRHALARRHAIVVEQAHTVFGR